MRPSEILYLLTRSFYRPKNIRKDEFHLINVYTIENPILSTSLEVTCLAFDTIYKHLTPLHIEFTSFTQFHMKKIKTLLRQGDNSKSVA